MLDMEAIGEEGGFTFFQMEMEIQLVDVLDLEQNKNGKGKVIHMMWARTSLLKFVTGPTAPAAA